MKLIPGKLYGIKSKGNLTTNSLYSKPFDFIKKFEIDEKEIIICKYPIIPNKIVFLEKKLVILTSLNSLKNYELKTVWFKIIIEDKIGLAVDVELIDLKKIK